VLAAATDEGVVKVFNCEEEGKLAGVLRGHTDSCQALAFHPDAEFMLTAGSDATFRMWS